MKKLIYGLLSVITLGFTLTSCSNQDEALNVAQEEAVVAPSEIFNSEAKQVITAAQLSGVYELKFESANAPVRVWKPARSVGSEMFPGTFLTYIGKFKFDSKTSKVAIATATGTTFTGNYKFKLSGEKLTITFGSVATSANLKVCSLEGKWLRLIDIRTKKGWVFQKK